MRGFLEEVSLLTDQDRWEEGAQRVSLMTIHAAKGLEFDKVAVVGLEEGLFPHMRALDDPDGLEEERRLAYVAITRGRERVTLSWARSRQRFGRLDFNPPSRFIREVPSEACSNEVEDRFQVSGGNRGGWAASANASRAQKKPAPKSWTRVSTERELDFEDNQSSGGATGGVGGQVTHPSFGMGIIKQLDGDGPNARVTVHFKTVGTKKIVARFLQFVE